MQNPSIVLWRTPEELGAYLKTIAPPKWYSKIAVHHTEVPTVSSWRGLSTMNSMLTFYRSKNWRSYPHIYVAPDGIWQMNNLQLKGTHTNEANSFAIAIEVVGNYNKDVWQEPIYSYTVETIKLLQQWGKLQQHDIVLHRTYNPTKTCPGTKITWDWIQTQLDKSKIEEIEYRVIFNGVRIRQGPSVHYPIAGMLSAGDTFASIATKDDEFKETINGVTTWAHVTRSIDTNEKVDHLGFVHSSLIERIR